MTITVAVFAVLAALLIGLLVALLFIVFAVGVALVFLLPTLFFTTLVATFIFLWGLGAYYLLKWFNEKKIPGIHTGLVEGLKDEFMDFTEPSQLDKLPSLNADSKKAQANGGQQAEPHESEKADSETPHKGQRTGQRPDKKKAGGEHTGEKHHKQNGSAKPPKLPPAGQNQLDTVGKTTGVDVGEVGKTAQGLRQNVPGGVL